MARNGNSGVEPDPESLKSDLASQELEEDIAGPEETEGTGPTRTTTRKTWVASQPALLVMLALLLLGGLALVWGIAQARSAPSGPSTLPSAVLTPSVQLDPNLDTILLELQKVYVRDGADAARQFAEKRLL